MATFTTKKTYSASFSATTARSAPSTPQTSVAGPIRRVRVQKKRPAGYGLFYSSDEEEEDEEDMENAQPSPPQTSMTTTSASSRAALKSLVFEKREFTKEELFGRPAPARTTTANLESTRRPSPPGASSSQYSARAARISPYGTPAAISRRPNQKQVIDISDDEGSIVETPAAIGRNKYTMRGGRQTPPRRRASPEPTSQPRQERQQKQPATPAPILKSAPSLAPSTAPAPIIESPFKAISGFLSAATGLIRRTAVVKPAELVREMDMEITHSPQGSTNGSPAAAEMANEDKEEEEEENKWPGSFNKTPVKQTASRASTEYVNPALALDPYGKDPNAVPKPLWSFDDGRLSTSRHSMVDKKRTRLSMSYDGQQNRNANLTPRRRFWLSDTKGSVANNDGSKKARVSLDLSSLPTEEKERIAEQRLMELAQAARERKVQERTDRYERRMIRSQLGRDWWGPEKKEREEEGEVFTDDDDEEDLQDGEKSKRKERERTRSKSPEARSSSPVASSPEPAVTASQPTSFLFGGGAYKPLAVPVTAPTTSVDALVSVSSPISPKKNNAPTLFTPASPSKSPAPPATPTLSHATLPNPAAPTGSALLPPPVPQSLTSPQKAVSGLGLADPALKARSQAEKFKPHVSSGLRASTTVPADSPPRANRNTGVFSNSPSNPPKATFTPRAPASAPAATPAQAPATEKKKGSPVSMYPLKAKKFGPHSDWIQAQMKEPVEVNQGYLDKFLEALGGGNKKEEKVVRAVDNIWRQPREEEKGLVKVFVDAIIAYNFAPL